MIQRLARLWARLEIHPAADVLGAVMLFALLIAGLWVTP